MVASGYDIIGCDSAYGNACSRVMAAAPRTPRLILPPRPPNPRVNPGLEPADNVASLFHVSTVTEIEHAIERLPDSDVARLAAWLAAYRTRRTPEGNGTHHDLDALIGSWREDPAFDAAIRTFDRVDESVWK